MKLEEVYQEFSTYAPRTCSEDMLSDHCVGFGYQPGTRLLAGIVLPKNLSA